MRPYLSDKFGRRATSVPKSSTKAKASDDAKGVPAADAQDKDRSKTPNKMERGKSPAKTPKKKKAAPLTMAALQAAKKEQMSKKS